MSNESKPDEPRVPAGVGDAVSRLALLERYLECAWEFSVGRFTVERFSHDGVSGWALSRGAWLYDRYGANKWRRSAGTRWHREEILIRDFGSAFTLAESMTLLEKEAEASVLRRDKPSGG